MFKVTAFILRLKLDGNIALFFFTVLQADRNHFCVNRHDISRQITLTNITNAWVSATWVKKL